ncbi:ABC transporter permease [Aeromonas hydrophila]|uniref:ABC transporter permease n=1 Tax=Aeromonas hydrophila TaxID=644 RepID=UPI000693988C|nr:ABC transporter permease [Aeromonas hydrophila]ANR99376.1 sugar ABC transporter permease [Aeromonas hydrophila]MCO4221991.1 ABC transporter permease [Aeromonas hydrophila]OSO91534.1 sugar ABC transporter permease [Aeromonas hydrophila]UUT51885.1 ABC transporter permease [Aeromonas hydrophila]WEF00693.1 ABC transporter permease [Aeromonas hydrophila]
MSNKEPVVIDNNVRPPINIFKLVLSIQENKGLVFALIKRDLLSKYKGSILGVLWSFITPLCMLLVYTFMFSVVFNARWGSNGNKSEFALVLFSGLMIFNFFSEVINRAPGLILTNQSYVKKVVFPLETLPFVICGAALVNLIISLVVWVLFYMFLFGIPHIEILLFPVILLPLMFMTVGITYILSSLGVFLRDLGQFISVVLTAMMFLSPIFYPVSALPTDYQVWMQLNPLTAIIESSRAVLINGELPDWRLYIMYFVVSFNVMWLGFAWFQYTKKGFSDVL